MERLFLETKMTATDTGEITGIAWPFGTPDRIGDVIEKGAFAKTGLPLPMLFGHDPNDPVGAWTDAEETNEGLQVKGNILIEEVNRAKEVHAIVKAGAVKGLSIGFQSKKAMPRKGGGRTIKELELLEVSLVAIPMHPNAKITSAKSAVTALQIMTAIQRTTAHFQKGK